MAVVPLFSVVTRSLLCRLLTAFQGNYCYSFVVTHWTQFSDINYWTRFVSFFYETSYLTQLFVWLQWHKLLNTIILLTSIIEHISLVAPMTPITELELNLCLSSMTKVIRHFFVWLQWDQSLNTFCCLAPMTSIIEHTLCLSCMKTVIICFV